MARIAVITMMGNSGDDVGVVATEALQVAGHQCVRENVRVDRARLKGILVAALADRRFDALFLLGDLPSWEQEAMATTLEQCMDRSLSSFAPLARQMLLPREGPKILLNWFCAGSWGGKLVGGIFGPPHRVSLLLTELLVPQMNELLEWARN